MSESIRLRMPEVCQILQCSRDHVYRLNRQGRLKKRNDSPRLSYWIRAEVEAFAKGLDPYAGQDNTQAQECTAHA